MDVPAYMKIRTQKEWKVYLQNLVRTNDRALLRAILAVYNNQTVEERTSGQNLETNKIGFTRWDVEEMSAIAKKVQTGIRLSPNEVVHSRLTMPKYWRQLMAIGKKVVAKRQAEEYNRGITKEQECFQKEIDRARVLCAEQGIACSYGICSECPVSREV